MRIKDGRGRLQNDVFAEDRLLLLPPSTSAILVLFNRNREPPSFSFISQADVSFLR